MDPSLSHNNFAASSRSNSAAASKENPAAEAARPTGGRTPQSEVHWPSVWQFALSALAILNLWGAAAIMVLMGFLALIMQNAALGNPLPLFMMALAVFVIGVLVLPSAIYALLRVLGKQLGEPPAELRALGCFLWPGVWVIALPVTLLLGYAVVTLTPLDWLLLPPLHILAVGLPVAWLLYVAVRNLPLGSPQRKWGVFSSGLVLGPFLIMILEGVAMLGFVILGALALVNRPEVVNELYSLSEWLMSHEPSPEVILDVVSPYLFQPAVILAMLAFGSVIVPLIEEALKPIGVWLLVGRNLRPAAGFAAGALSGAGYALFESLALTSGGEDWAFMVVARIGTAVVHILTTGLTGWALTLAWQRRRYALLGLTYLGMVFIHGLWNGMTLFFSFATLGTMQDLSVELPPIFDLASVAPFVLMSLTLVGLLALLMINCKLVGSGQSGPPAEGSDEEMPDGASEESVL